MTDYIEREKLIEFARNSTVGIDANDIARFPATDVRPVVHGRWVNESRWTARCSKCRFPVYPRDKTRYCPNCGANLTVEKRETKRKVSND